MEKKYQLRPYSKTQELARPNWDNSGRKCVEKLDYGKKLPANRTNRTNQRFARTREKVGPKEESSEVGSLQKSGSKKQNITHLLNWWDTGPDPRAVYSSFEQKIGTRNRHLKSSSYIKFNKEHYLQANCQFIVPIKCDLSSYESDPDRLIDWDQVEEVRLHSVEHPACPICLHSPTAAKITKCGHIFCFPCVLHYLALTDRKWQKCPICYDAITKENLKSVVTVVHKSFRCGEDIELTLMRRERNSNTPTPVLEYSRNSGRQVTLSNFMENPFSTYSRFILATNNEINDLVLQREYDELQCQFALEGDQPEACFISEALNIVENRKSCLFAGNASTDHLLAKEESPSQDLFTNFQSQNLGFPEARENLCRADFSSKDIIHDNEEICTSEDIVPQIIGPDGLKSTFFFYQESSGAHLYLHPINVRILLMEYGNLDQCPLSIKGKILEKESCTVTEDIRHRLRYLRHLPIACPFELVEIELKPPLVSIFSLMHFKDQLKQREKKRKKRMRQENTIERRVQIEEDRMMGRSRGSSFNMTSFRHFPSFNDDLGATAISSNTDDEAVLSSSVSSTDCMQGTPSFAQMIRSGKKKACSGGPVYSSNVQRKQDANVDSDENEKEVPDFGTAFSDAFAKALDLATQNAAKELNSPTENGPRSKKKKKKGILLLSSGGR